MAEKQEGCSPKEENKVPVLVNMRKLCLTLALSSFVSLTWAQQAIETPLGVLITPHQEVRVSKQLRAILPPKSTARLVQPTSMGAGGEEVVVYDAGDQYEPHAHVAVVRDGHRVADFSVTKLFGRRHIGDTYELFAATQLALADGKHLFVAAFRNIGNGAGTIFVLLAERKSHYEIAWMEGTIQGRFKLLRTGAIQVWNAENYECTWCPHHYDVNSFEWKDGRLAKVGHFRTQDQLDPGPISDRPIVIEK